MIKKWYQKVQNGEGRNITVLNFAAIAKENANVFLILSERNRQGKTCSALQYVRTQYLEKRETSLLILNTEVLYSSATKLITANKKIYPEMWENVVKTNKGLFDKKTGEIFLHFCALTQYAKFKIGGRDVNIKTILYDEFNEGLKTVGNNQATFFDSVLYSAFDTARNVQDCNVFIFGNTLSVDVPLLRDWGIKHLPKGDKEEIERGPLKIIFYTPKTTKEQREQIEKEKNWMHSLSKLSGHFEKSVIGDYTLDNMVGIVPEEDQHHFKQNTRGYYLKLDENFFLKLWQSSNNQVLFLEYKKHNLKASTTFCLKPSLLEPKIILFKDWKHKIIAGLESHNVFFDSITSKRGLIKGLGL